MSTSKSGKTWKILGGIVGLLVALFLILIFSLGSVVETGIEEYGPRITGTDVDVGAVTLSPLTGKLGISSLSVENPQGFETDNALKMDSFRIHVDTRSVFSDVVKIHELVIHKPEISYENANGKNNLKVLQANVNRYVPESKGEEEKKSKPKKLIVDRILIKEAKVIWKPAFKPGDPLELTLPDIELKNLGTESGGVPPSEIVSRVLGEIRSNTAGVVAGAAKELKGAAKEVGGAVKEGAEEIGEGVKSLFE